MWLDWLLLVAGILLLIKGADYFVDGSSKIAKALKIPSLIIGLTLVSMGTSAPELSVSLLAALENSSDLSFGNVVGSDIFNTFLILGVASIFIPLAINKDMKKYDIPIMIGLYVLMIIFAFVISPYKLDMVESIIFIVLFVAYIALLIYRAKKGKVDEEESNEAPSTVKNLVLCIILAAAGVLAWVADFFEKPSLNYISCGVMAVFVVLMLINIKKPFSFKSNKVIILLNVLYAIAGLFAIVGGGTMVVGSAKNIAKALGMSEAIIGLTIVAVGTSLPELVTSVVASIKKENDIAIGNVIGSNIFNILFILGVSSSISNLKISDTQAFGISNSLIDLLVLLLSGIAVMLISLFGKNIKKWQGIIFIILYVAYVAYLIMREFA